MQARKNDTPCKKGWLYLLCNKYRVLERPARQIGFQWRSSCTCRHEWFDRFVKSSNIFPISIFTILQTRIKSVTWSHVANFSLSYNLQYVHLFIEYFCHFYLVIYISPHYSFILRLIDVCIILLFQYFFTFKNIFLRFLL